MYSSAQIKTQTHTLSQNIGAHCTQTDNNTCPHGICHHFCTHNQFCGEGWNNYGHSIHSCMCTLNHPHCTCHALHIASHKLASQNTMGHAIPWSTHNSQTRCMRHDHCIRCTLGARKTCRHKAVHTSRCHCYNNWGAG